MQEYQLFVIPGLLQTAAYTRARAELTRIQGGVSEAEAARSVDARQMRQRMLSRPGGPSYLAVVDEVAVRRPAAAAPVMREQLLHLADLAEGDGRTGVRVLRQDAELRDYWLPRSPFSVYRYRNGDPTAVAVDNETVDLVYTTADEVKPYVELWDRVDEAALSVTDSAALLRAAATSQRGD
ncbi:hypothetical protein GCM10010123_27930 [Pilimelia anulata]|uniref:DUF5753 domain-containing protein n=1 Tax=Pilimelia anulata TaxID=53371 RepID=A0A8J3FDJ2_9ACTN|nr:DUF5753 domain-containing protein [Pilimelia anulata]GGJ96374.1 hypothetical protein GCM10010123_27930 [Pilimelia anulata]